ncbi:MAG: pyridoxamine 5'-phosphate oxidase [Chloroflexi bacterium]|nr:MAG: pyridoxamine 5'-phosphate oxidase [Actinobacteria bacterium 13_2_20CM_2_66_6]TMD35868.1 MAG: pyridoxamine 5'-phosphate oxidase [Chloroflexota bacterium]TMD72476.1 MAG: pyridoxamine 5'-phosphate oxidase [Chloroflexota bacterium]
MPLLEEEAPEDPYQLFQKWYGEAMSAGVPQPDAMTLATAGEEGPSARMVLYKGLQNGSFIFYSNYDSRKGRDLSHDRRAALVFYWSAMRHQVRVYGVVRKLKREESAAYFATRPRGAQLSALASPQSRVVRGRGVLERKVVELASLHPDGVPLPRAWGGYALRPVWIEFWENRDDRLHDRLRYIRNDRGAWRFERLAP